MGFGGCCELTCLWGCFTAQSRQARLDRHCLERQGETEAGTLTAWRYFGIWLQSPTVPTQGLEAAGQSAGLKDLGFHSTSLLRIGRQVGGMG